MTFADIAADIATVLQAQAAFAAASNKLRDDLSVWLGPQPPDSQTAAVLAQHAQQLQQSADALKAAVATVK